MGRQKNTRALSCPPSVDSAAARTADRYVKCRAPSNCRESRQRQCVLATIMDSETRGSIHVMYESGVHVLESLRYQYGYTTYIYGFLCTNFTSGMNTVINLAEVDRETTCREAAT